MTEEDPNRFERKFFISELSGPEVVSLIKLHPAMFSEIYHERFVNNIYFDTPDRNLYRSSLDGAPNRVKLRIRWYGNLKGWVESPRLELKMKHGYVGKKKSYPLITFNLDRLMSRAKWQGLFRQCDLPEALKEELTVLEPFLINRFRRRYFQSASGHFRMTVDTDLQYFRIRFDSVMLLGGSVPEMGTILELKYGLDKDHLAHQITQHFPFRITKNSKYVVGVEKAELTFF